MPTFSREQPKPLKFDAWVNARNSRRLAPSGPTPSFKHWLRRMGQGQCELVHTAVAQLRALYMLMMGNGHWGDTMHHGFKLASREASLSHWGFAPQVAMALVVIVLLTFMVAALEVFLSGNESLSALEAAMMY